MNTETPNFLHLPISGNQAATVSNAHVNPVFAPMLRAMSGDIVRAQGTDAIKCSLPATNDGELSQADLDAIDAQFAEADLADCRDRFAARRAREEEAGQVERVMKPHLWEQS